MLEVARSRVVTQWISIGLVLLSCGVVAEPATPQPLISQAGALQPQWKTFKGPGIELSLPENFVGGSPSLTGSQLLIARFRLLGSQFDSIADVIEQNPTAYSLIAVDPQPDAMGGVTNVVVSTAAVSAATTVNSYLDSVVKQLPTPIKLVERKLVQIGKQQAGRLVTEASWEKGTLKQLLYVVKQDRNIWTIAYSTGANEYEQRLPMFEQSITRFKGQTISKTAPVRKKG